MKGRSKAGPTKPRRRKPAAPKRSGGAEAARPRTSSAAGQEGQIAQLVRERDEALEQLSAASDVLKVISSSPGELQPVFEAMLQNAVLICRASFGNLWLREGDKFRIVAIHGGLKEYREYLFAEPLVQPDAQSAMGRIAQTRESVQIEDISNAPTHGMRMRIATIQIAKARTLVGVPMLKEGNVVGIIAVYRQEVRLFDEKQIALLRNFAAQAVIAIENARLLNELKQRTADLSESLEQQTATSEVLRVISSSQGDLEPVFQTMLENATHLCEAGSEGSLTLRVGNDLKIVARHNPPAELVEATRLDPIFRPGRASGLGRSIRLKEVVQVPDMINDQAYIDRDPARVRLVEAGYRSQLSVPLIKDSEAIGAFNICRKQTGIFTEKQIELVKNFAAQAVIAIENARLLNELRQRTTDLTESLEQQTATSEVLKVISSSPGELEPVFETILENATRICEAKFGVLYLFDGNVFRWASQVGAPPEFAEFLKQRQPFPPIPGTVLNLVAETKTVVHIADDRTSANPSAPARLAGARSTACVPMLKDDALIGAIVIYRQEVRPFTDKQIALVENFAAQAVIAIENARLLDDLNKLNQQLEQRVDDQVGEIERMGRLRRFLPPQVADLIVASGTEKQLESHRREITALFCDLRGFTGFSESSDPEDVMALLAEYHAAIGTIINKYSGTLERYAGDGVMVIFNDPVPVENPPLQAVLMALDMRSAIEALMEKWRLLGHDIGFGIGIAHGFATLGTIGFEGRRDYAAIGTVSNVASRLCDEAKPGQILISPRVMLAVDKTITVEPVGEFELKGIRRPMAAYNVLASSSSKPN